MQMADALLVLFELDCLAVELELSASDAVGAAAGCCAEIGGMERIVLESLEAERQRRVVALQPQVLNDCAPGENVGRQAAAGDRHAVHIFALGRLAEQFSVHIDHSLMSLNFSGNLTGRVRGSHFPDPRG
jgi:hypothetical protein